MKTCRNLLWHYVSRYLSIITHIIKGLKKVKTLDGKNVYEFEYCLTSNRKITFEKLKYLLKLRFRLNIVIIFNFYGRYLSKFTHKTFLYPDIMLVFIIRDEMWFCIEK